MFIVYLLNSSFKLCNAATPAARATAGHTLLLLTALCSVLLARSWTSSCTSTSTTTTTAKRPVHSAKKRGRWRQFFHNKNNDSVEPELCSKCAESLSSASSQLLCFEPCTNCLSFSRESTSHHSHNHLMCGCLETNQISSVH